MRRRTAAAALTVVAASALGPVTPHDPRPGPPLERCAPGTYWRTGPGARWAPCFTDTQIPGGPHAHRP